MAAPGSLEARYQGVAGRRHEWYAVRRHLGIGIDEWEGMPWWQKKVYRDGMREEAEAAERAAEGQETGSQNVGASGGMGLIDAIYDGSMADVEAARG